ncbi:hypothetical protein [Sphingomonas daechungensis]|uniref:hypothetical protein n=1 Tax=Sphingomonas daechungensis TaxID=1176646 RepID=UPI0031E7DA1D
MLDLMFAAAVSGMRIGAEQESSAPAIGLRAESDGQSNEDGNHAHDWRPDVSFEDDEDCPIFFQREIGGVGTFRVGPQCADDGLPHAL